MGDVAKRREADPEWYAQLEAEYFRVFRSAEEALEAGDWQTVGTLANKNHELLSKLGVSCPELDVLVEAARGAGACGAKLAGTGRGGLMIAVTPDAETQNAVYNALSELTLSSCDAEPIDADAANQLGVERTKIKDLDVTTVRSCSLSLPFSLTFWCTFAHFLLTPFR